MNHQDDLEARCVTGIDASTMAMIRPTDIMLGRGPKCYNNSGNKVLRKLIKEHVVHYKSKARRREKAALVKLLVSKLQVNGYRFLHLSPSGIWIEAPLHVAERKIGHGLRDARLSVTRNTVEDIILPKNFRPSYTEPTNNKDHVEPVLSCEPNIMEETQNNVSDVNQGDTTGTDPHQGDVSPTTLLIFCTNNVVTSTSSARAAQRVQGAQFTSQCKERQLVHTNSVLQEHTYVQDTSENGNFASLDCDNEEDIDHWNSGGDVNSKTGGRPRGFKSSSEVEQRWGNWGHYWEDMKNTTSLPYATPSMGDTHDDHSLNAVDMALDTFSPAYGRTFDNLLDDDQYQPMGSAVEDAQSLCQWFSRNLA